MRPLFQMAMLTPHVKSNSPVIVPSTFKLYFNTEFTSCYRAPGSCLLGPDGPWQALVLNFGSGINLLPLYPRFETYGTTVLTTGEDRYNSSISSTSRKTGLQFLDDWARYAADVRSFVNQSYPISGAMTPYFDDMQLARSLSPDPRFNSTLFAAYDWNYKTVNGSSYTPRVGLWGLRGVEGPETGDVNASNILPPGPLEQLKSNGIIGTETYFPCHSTGSASGTWLLGRAFLQAVFYGVDYEKKQRWIGQGPGPGQQQMIVKTWPTGTDTFQASPADSYASTWRKHWTVLPEESNETSTQKPGNQTSGGSGLSGGIIAGIAVGSVALLAILAGALWWWFMRKRRIAVHTKEGGKGMSLDQRHELGIEQRERHELGPEQRHELGAEQRHEPPVQRVVHEMPGSTPGPIQVETRRPAGGGNSSERI
ncbi:hypothetical protein CRV24_001229 [Beauveria bassiana]|nr:hypothetical protein CRV24_001229 [Beauveria bassiana]